MSTTVSKFSGDEIFYVMGEGWYVELPHRVLGPYPSREVAVSSLQQQNQRAMFRGGRYFHVADRGWFVNTREGEKGPFFSRRQAELFVGQLIQNTRGQREELWMGR